MMAFDAMVFFYIPPQTPVIVYNCTWWNDSFTGTFVLQFFFRIGGWKDARLVPTLDLPVLYLKRKDTEKGDDDEFVPKRPWKF